MRDELDHNRLLAYESSNSLVAILRMVKRPCGILGGILLAIFLLSTALRAFLAAYDSDNFPEALLVKVEILPLIFPLHMVTGGLALVLVPVTYLLRGTQFHKWVGRLTVADIVVAGGTAIPVALTAPVAPMAAAGFSTQGLVWLLLIAKGVWHIRRGEIAAHRNAMMMMAAVTSGALFFRIYLAVWAIIGNAAWFKTFYAVDSWIAWAVPLALTSFIIWRRRS